MYGVLKALKLIMKVMEAIDAVAPFYAGDCIENNIDFVKCEALATCYCQITTPVLIVVLVVGIFKIIHRKYSEVEGKIYSRRHACALENEFEIELLYTNVNAL